MYRPRHAAWKLWLSVVKICASSSSLLWWEKQFNIHENIVKGTTTCELLDTNLKMFQSWRTIKKVVAAWSSHTATWSQDIWDKKLCDQAQISWSWKSNNEDCVASKRNFCRHYLETAACCEQQLHIEHIIKNLLT